MAELAMLLLRPPFDALEESVRAYVCEALGDVGTFDLDEAAEVFAPFLVEAELAADEAAARELCRAFVPGGDGHTNTHAGLNPSHGSRGTPPNDHRAAGTIVG
eukprot:NODE_30886_length_408_cov_1.387900.p2 GENE.NODE_30886_length_408_cov_1.387900~~NODE_30886_length_408_cov_1.387900.p2  ORF type:complete len:103 (-),score=39.50 NODE_30886_length_408_cov_1.387900:11-319(-)